jgi:hypothetical protein
MQALPANQTCKYDFCSVDIQAGCCHLIILTMKIGAKNLETGAWSALQMLLSAAQDISSFEQKSKVNSKKEQDQHFILVHRKNIMLCALCIPQSLK